MILVSRQIMSIRSGKIAAAASLGIAAIGMVVLAGGLPVKASSNSHDDFDGNSNPRALQGTWIVQESLDPSSLPPGGVLNFMRLETYAAGGGFLETNNGLGAGGPAGQGSWVALNHREFASTEMRLGFDAANVFTGTTKIRSHITISHDGTEMTGNVQVDIILPNGVTLPFHPSGTFRGTRLAVEPLN